MCNGPDGSTAGMSPVIRFQVQSKASGWVTRICLGLGARRGLGVRSFESDED